MKFFLNRSVWDGAFPRGNPAIQTLFVSCFVLLLSIPLFFDAYVSMITGWNSSETYSHCYFVIPTSLFLIWHQRYENLPSLNPTPWLCLALIPGGLLWLLGKAAGVLIVEQVSLLMLVAASIVILIGLPLAKRLWFPICFMFLAVPFGEELLPVMMEFTADFTVAGLQMMGFPVFREGNNFSLPSGNWSVVEACSGVRYLIASFTIGALYAYITYTSFLKRSLFLVAAVIVPVLGNGLRAIMIVLIGHYSSMTLATGVDHLVYGWLFFGVLMFVLFWIGGFFADKSVGNSADKSADKRVDDDTDEPISHEIPTVRLMQNRTLLCAVAVVFVLLIWPLWGLTLQSSGDINKDANIQVNFIGDFTPCHECDGLIKPDYASATYQLVSYLADDKNMAYQVNVITYDSRALEGELVNSQNRIIDREGHQHVVQSQIEVFAGSSVHKVTVSGKTPVRVWHFNMLNSDIVNSRIMFKAKEAMLHILGRDYLASAVIISRPITESAQESDQHIADFITKNKPTIDLYLKQLAQ